MCVCVCNSALVYLVPLCSVYHLEKKKEALDKAKRQRVEVLLTTPDTVRTHVVCHCMQSGQRYGTN